MAEFKVMLESAPIERYTPVEMKQFKASADFIPVHHYAVDVDYGVGHGEVGILIKDGHIYKRLFYV